MHQKVSIPQSAPRRLCVLRLSAIGDCCNLVPVVRTLQAHWPDTQITWVAGAAEAALLDGLDGVEIITHPKRAGIRALRRQLNGRQFDVLMLMQVALRAGWLSTAVSAPVRLGFDRDRARDGHGLFINRRIARGPRGHVIDGFFGFCEALGLHERVMRWDIPVPAAAADEAAQRLPADSPVLVVSPCSSQRRRNYRNWRAEHYAAVARQAARDHGLAIVLTGGGSAEEIRYGAEIEALLQGPPAVPVTNLIGRTDLKTLFAVLGRATAVIAPDSGPVHMAVAAGTPAIGLYATSNPDRTGPVLGHQWVVNAYPEAVRQAFGCEVEAVRWGRRVRDPDAMDLITPDRVQARLDALMATPADQRLRAE